MINVIGREETAMQVSDPVNGATTAPHSPGVMSVKTPVPGSVVRKETSRGSGLRRGAGQRSVTGREEGLARPVRREMKPEPSDAPADAAGDFEQLEADRPDGRRDRLRGLTRPPGDAAAIGIVPKPC